MKQRTWFALSGLAAAALTVSMVLYAVPPCWEVCSSSGWCAMGCTYDGGCRTYYEVCIGSTRYCRAVCWNGTSFQTPCHGAPCGGGGGSPVFMKLPCEEYNQDVID